MLQQPEFIVTTEDEFAQIESVKAHIDEMHATGDFFNLSLQALEMIRRFKNLYTEVFEKEHQSANLLNQLVIVAKGLEIEFVQKAS